MPEELFLSYDDKLDWLTLIEFGRVENAQPRDHWRGVSESFGYALDGSEGSEVGFKVLNFSYFDPEDPEVAEIWEGPRFDVPALGLRGSTAGEIVLAARPFLGGRSTVNRLYFNAAMQAVGPEAEEHWRYCLQAGDLMAHYGLGYTLYDLGRYREAYRHLRAYTELVPTDGWAWSWLGKACEAMGETDEAESTYRKAINLDGDETDAPELLVNMLDSMFRQDPEAFRNRDAEEPGAFGMKFIGEAPELGEGVEVVIEDGFRKGDLVFFEPREDGKVAIRQMGTGDIAYYVHPASAPGQPTFIRTNTRHLTAHRDDDAVAQLWKETFSNVGFFRRDTDLQDGMLKNYRRGAIIQEHAFIDCTYLESGLAARHRYLIITGKARDLHELAGLDPRYGPAIIQRDAFFKVLDVYQSQGRSQVTLLHIPAELVDRLRTQEPNEIEEEMVEAARRDFEQSLQSPTVPALTEPEWTDRVAFPLGMNDEGELFYQESS